MKTEFNQEQRQLNKVAAYLKKHKTVTSMRMIQTYGITRLSHYIYLLRNSGWDISMKKEYNPKTKANYGVYTLENEPNTSK